MAWIEVSYHLRSSPEAVKGRAAAIALEQSIEMPVEAVRSASVLSDILGRVIAVDEIGPGLFRVEIALAAETVGDDAGQLLNMLFGNTSLHDDVSLQDVRLPAELAAGLGSGPRFGVEGLRRRVGAGRRALTCSALKPQGLPPAELALLAERFAAGGIDYVKDDHGLANQAYSPFAERVPACAAAIRRAAARTGHPTRYVPSLSGDLERMRGQIALMRAEGLDTALVAPMIAGLATAQTLARDNPDIAFLSHPSLAGAAKIAPACLAKLLRLIGLDGVIFPNHGGRFGYSSPACLEIAAAARAAWSGVAPAMPIPAGGMSVARVPEMLDFYGDEVMLLIGGNLLASDDITAATAGFVATVAELSRDEANG